MELIDKAIQPCSNWVTTPCIPFECDLGVCILDSGIKVNWYVALCKMRPLKQPCWKFNIIVLFVDGEQVKSISDFSRRANVNFFEFFAYISKGKTMPSLN